MNSYCWELETLQRKKRERSEFSAQHKPFLSIFMLHALSQEAEPMFNYHGSCGPAPLTPLPPWAPGQCARGQGPHLPSRATGPKSGEGVRGRMEPKRDPSADHGVPWATLAFSQSPPLKDGVSTGDRCSHSQLPAAPPIHYVHLPPQILKCPGTLPHGMGETTCPC